MDTLVMDQRSQFPPISAIDLFNSLSSAYERSSVYGAFVQLDVRQLNSVLGHFSNLKYSQAKSIQKSPLARN